MAAQLNLVQHRTLWEIHIQNILSGTSSSIRTKLWWNSHWMVLFQIYVRQSMSPAKMTATVQVHHYWKQLWSRWAITDSWEPLVCLYFLAVLVCNFACDLCCFIVNAYSVKCSVELMLYCFYYVPNQNKVFLSYLILSILLLFLQMC
jgi:hypothetical protein